MASPMMPRERRKRCATSSPNALQAQFLFQRPLGNSAFIDDVVGIVHD
ncbi:hypothetical protein LP420_01575 [Massilia sp. B-10]|nr:hypothetical protein LP420_01575 [Massilia sp. B-10]UUZ54744.1 hypothetical protein LP419_01470 [Massilia sp. H-1]